MLNNPAHLIAEQPVFAGTKSSLLLLLPLFVCYLCALYLMPSGVSGKKARKAQNNISSFASSTLAKAAFLCTVLLEEPDCHHLSFRVGLFGLEMPRPPASSKALEVSLSPHTPNEIAFEVMLLLSCVLQCR